MVESLSTRSDIPTMLAPTPADFDSVVAATKSAIAEAAARQAQIDDNALIAVTIPDEVRQQFHELVRQAWEGGRAILGLLLSAGGCRYGIGATRRQRDSPSRPRSIRNHGRSTILTSPASNRSLNTSVKPSPTVKIAS
jgi:hypothetical protein